MKKTILCLALILSFLCVFGCQGDFDLSQARLTLFQNPQLVGLKFFDDACPWCGEKSVILGGLYRHIELTGRFENSISLTESLSYTMAVCPILDGKYCMRCGKSRLTIGAVTQKLSDMIPGSQNYKAKVVQK